MKTRTTTDLLTGKPYRWNDTVIAPDRHGNLTTVPAMITGRDSDHLAPSREDMEQLSAFEAQVDRVAAMLRSGIDDNRITAVRKVDPHKAGGLADKLQLMQADLRRIEVALREAAIQTSFLDAAN